MSDVPDFEAMYANNPDPFGVRDTWYERRKLNVLLATLLRERYAAAWDPACGTGDLASALSWRCDQVLATDASEQAVRITSALTVGQSNVHVRRETLPNVRNMRPAFDLVIASEVLFYLPAPARARTVQLLDAVTCEVPNAEVVAVHWRHHPHDAQLSGVAVTAELGAALTVQGWAPAVYHDDGDFVLASWQRDGPSASRHRPPDRFHHERPQPGLQPPLGVGAPVPDNGYL